MDIQWMYVITGLVVGFIVGLTGVGGGSLMTPILLHFGVAPLHAVGTDLLYAALTKSGGIGVHHARRNIDWSITGALALGSVPAACFTVWWLRTGRFHTESINHLITTLLGVALVLTALLLFGKGSLLRYSQRRELWFTHLTASQQTGATVVVGLLLGVLVSITSIGAGALGTVALFLLYPQLPTVKLVGTEIAHAVPLTLIAGLGHASSGHVDWVLLANLLVGSLPGIYLGCRLAHIANERYLRPALATMLLLIGGRLVF